MIYTMKKKKESGFWKRLKSLKVMKKRSSTGSGGKDTKTQERDRGIFWDVNRERSQRDNELRSINTIAEADILRQELINRDVP